jgi:carnitine O-acetyltransferase
MLPPEMTKAGPLCMNQYRWLFGITRVPKAGCDVIVGQHPAHSKHIVVSFRDQFYAVDIFDPSGARVPIAAIEKYVRMLCALERGFGFDTD